MAFKWGPGFPVQRVRGGFRSASWTGPVGSARLLGSWGGSRNPPCSLTSGVAFPADTLPSLGEPSPPVPLRAGGKPGEPHSALRPEL